MNKTLRDVVVLAILAFITWIVLKIFFFTMKNILFVLLFFALFYFLYRMGFIRKLFRK